MTFSLTIHSYGRYSTIEHNLARTVAHSLHREFGDRYVLRDELGRQVVFDSAASHGSTDSIVIVEKPS